MIGFKVKVLLTRLADEVLNKVGICIATSKREFFLSILEAIFI